MKVSVLGPSNNNSLPSEVYDAMWRNMFSQILNNNLQQDS
jgi:hypothetical protein